MNLASKILLSACTYLFMFSLPAEAMKGSKQKETKEATQKSTQLKVEEKKDDAPKAIPPVLVLSSFKDFKDLYPRQYFKRCMPNHSDAEIKAAAIIFNILLKEAPAPIIEDDSTQPFQVGLVRSESGYSFRPIMEIQGPFLQCCASGAKRILDIGAGNGNDTIPILLCRNVQVVAVDIHRQQLEQLKARVVRTVGALYPEVVQKYFSTFKRDFADTSTKVPEQFLGAFHGANVNKVPHFLNGAQFSTLARNVARMLCDGAVLSLTVSTYLPNSREAKWIAEQEKQGLEDPGLLYYDRKGHEYAHVKRELCELPSPGHKVEFLEKGQPILRTGRYFHTLETLHTFLDPYFDIVDHHTVQVDAEDIFLTILARKKPNPSN